MLKPDCLFCKIIQGFIPSDIIAENDYVTVIKDIKPRAPVHYLILPKDHYENLFDMTAEHEPYIWHVMTMAQQLGKSLETPQAFNLVCNNGKEAGQVVFHQHFHFLSQYPLAGGGITFVKNS